MNRDNWSRSTEAERWVPCRIATCDGLAREAVRHVADDCAYGTCGRCGAVWSTPLTVEESRAARHVIVYGEPAVRECVALEVAADERD